MVKTYDVGIVGAGVAGCLAAYKLCFYKSTKVILFDIGKSFAKRRRQLEGALGCFPNGDGKLYSGDFEKVHSLVDGRKLRKSHNWLMDLFQEIGPCKEIKDSLPNSSLQKKIKELNFDIETNNYIQWKPEYIHKLSKIIADKIEETGNIELSFDNQVYKIYKKKNLFNISTANGDFLCKKIIFGPGRSGWRWATDIYKELGLSSKDNVARFGMRLEISGQYTKDLNKSHCKLIRKDVEVGPFFWNGTVIPEDHADVVISAFRSNEDRWKTEKVSFPVIGSVEFPDQGVAQCDRLAKLAFLLSNDRVGKERIRDFMKDKNDLCLIPEYGWLKNVITELYELFPLLQTRGSYHVPAITALPSEINLSKELESDLEGMYIVGEAAGIQGIMAASLMGILVSDEILK